MYIESNLRLMGKRTDAKRTEFMAVGCFASWGIAIRDSGQLNSHEYLLISEVRRLHSKS